MMVYFLVCVPFLIISTAVALMAARQQPQFFRQLVWVVIPLILLTVIFDNLLTGLPIVNYDSSLISGIRIGSAPIEDLSYTIAVVLLVPSLWILLGRD